MLTALLLAATPVTIAIKTDLLEFDYSWSAEAAAVPQLDRRFRANAARQQFYRPCVPPARTGD